MSKRRGVAPTELIPDPRTLAAADHRQRVEWMRCAKAVGDLDQDIYNLTKELGGLRKRRKRLVSEMVRAASEERLPLFEAQFEGGKR